jgi:protein phosphatase
VAVAARAVHYEPARPFPVHPGLAGGEGGDGAVPASGAPGPTPAATGVGRRDPDLLDIGDVTGDRVVETRHHGRVSVRAENAAAALEVVSRFAVDPRWLVHLPPTMSPVATSSIEGLLEHPDQAFEAYRADGVTEVVCQEKHMGSRALALVCRDETAALERFGAPGGALGSVWTRTGRPFLPGPLLDELVERLRTAAGRAGLFDELSSGWLLLDAEILPWDVKAAELLRTQYAAVGAAGRSALPAAVEVLSAAAERGQDVRELLARTSERAADVDAFTAAYRRYCWPTEGLDGVRVAPFQVLASEGASHVERDHGWHLALADRLVAADPSLLLATRRVVADTSDASSTAAATAWWEELTASGREGMVVKPLAGLTTGPRGLVQPGLKVRGREYLRIIYGPDYTLPENLERLRQRGLGRKRSLALREYALGVEALERVARGEPLWRVHECVVGVLALESEPVDPRL